MSQQFRGEKRANELGTAPLGRLMLKFSLPAVVSLLVNSLYNIVDQIFIGHGVGYLGNAVTNVSFPFVSMTLALSLLLGNGCAANFSLSLGRKERDKAARYVGNALALQFGVGTLLALTGIVFLEPLLRIFGATETIMAPTMEYAGTILMGTPLVLVSVGLANVVRADGSPRYAMWSAMIGAVLNTILDPLFIFPQWLGMGVKGAAVATVISQFVSFVVTLAYVRRFQYIELCRHHFKLHWQTLCSIVTLGVSSLLNQVTLTIVQIVMNNSLTYYGALSVYGAEIPLSALGIVMKVNQILMSVLIGIGIGGQPLLGYNYGAGDYGRVRRVYLMTLIATTLCGLLGLLVFQFFPDSIIALFGSENELYNNFARQCFRIFLMTVPFLGLHTSASIFFQATGRPARSIVLTLVQRLLFMVPAVLVLPLFGGLEGLLYTAPLADCLATVTTASFMVPELMRLRRCELGGPCEDQ